MAARRSGVDELAPFVLTNVEGLKGDSEEAGHGAYGVIYNVTVNGLPYVAKRLHKALVKQVRNSEDIKKKFRSECITLSRLKHPNVVHFIGVQYGRERSDLTLIMECLHCDLSSFLETCPQVPLPLKLSILLDVTYGLLYLHTHDPPVVHRDLTDGNVLVTTCGRAKLADLGMAKLLTPKALMAVNKNTKIPGRLLYMPPETLTENPECTPKIDIFSFGHLSLFTINQEDPEVIIELTNVPRGTKGKGGIQALKRRHALEKVGQDHCMHSLIIRCLHDNPTQRPSSVKLTEKMQELCTMNRPSKGVALFNGDMIKEYAALQAELLELRAENTHKETQLAEIRRENILLHQRVKEFSDAKEELQKKYHGVLDQMKTLDRIKGQMEAFRTQVSTATAKVTANIKRMEELQDEVEASKQQALQYKEDFERERKDREEAAGRHVEELAHWQCDYQKLEQKCCDQQEVFQQTQRVLDEEIIKLRKENRQKAEKITELKEETIKQRNAFGAESTQHIAELNKQLEITRIAKAKLEKCVAEPKEHLEIALNEDTDLKELARRLQDQHTGLQRDKVDLQKQLDGAIKDTANLSDELMAKNQQVKQFRKKVEEFRGHLNETRTELDRVKGQLQQTRTRMQEQAQFYQEQLKQTGEEAESKAQIEKESCESDKMVIENELRQVKRRYTELRDRYDVMFKHHDQLKTILRQHNISPPPLPKVSHGTPTQYQTEHVQREIQAVPILTRDLEPVDPSTLPQPIEMPRMSVYRDNQPATQGGQYPQYSQAGGGQVQYPYDASRDGMQGGHQLAVQGQLGYQTNMDPSQYQTQGGGVVSINERGFRSGNFEELRRNKMQQNVGAMQAQGRMRAGSDSNRDDMNFQRLHQGRGRAIQHDRQRSLTASDIGVASKYADVQYNQPDQAYAGGQAGQFSNQPPANQINPQSSPKYNIPRQQGNGNVSSQQQQQQQLQSQHGQNLGYPRASAASEQSQGVAGMQGVAVGMNAGQQLRSGLPAYIQADKESRKRPQFPNQQVPSNQPLPPNPSGPQENVLIAGMHAYRRHQDEQSLALDAPIDPNLVCQMCRRGFKIGEIQKYRRHVASCTGSSS